MKKIKYLLLIIMLCFNFGCSGNPWIGAIKQRIEIETKAYLQKNYTLCKKTYEKLIELDNPYLNPRCEYFEKESIEHFFNEAVAFNYFKEFKWEILKYELEFETKNKYFSYRIYKVHTESTIITDKDENIGSDVESFWSAFKYKNKYYSLRIPNDYLDSALAWFEQNQK